MIIHINLIKSFALMLLFVVSLGLNQCKEKQSDDKTIHIAVPQAMAAIPLLELEGSMVNGKRIQTHTYTDHIVAMGSFMRKDYDLILTGFTLGAKNYSSSKSVQQLTTIIWGIASIITAEQADSLNDLENKTLHVPFKGSPLDLLTRAAIKNENIKNLTVEYATVQQAMSMFLAGKAQAVALPEPFASKLVIEHNAYRAVTYPDLWAGISKGSKLSPQVSLFMHSDTSDSDKADYLALREKMIQTIIEMKSEGKDISFYAKKYAQKYNISHAVFAESFANTYYSIPENSKQKELIYNYIKTVAPQLSVDDGFFVQ